MYMPDIEPNIVGDYDDTQLVAIDQLMVEAQPRGMSCVSHIVDRPSSTSARIKLIITLHDRYQLGCWGNDSCVSKFDLPAVDCNYEQASAQ